MPDTYVKLPNGQYVQIPEGATPDQLQQMKSRLVQMQASAQPPDAVAQSRAQMAARVHPVPLISPGKEQAPTTSSQEEQINKALPQVNQRVKDIRSAALAMGGSGVGSELGSAAAQGLPKFAQLMATASGAGAGAGAGALAGGASPKEALGTAAGTTATTAVVSPFLKWLTASKSVGAQALQAASEKAGNAPVELSAKTNEIVDKIVQQGGSGGSTPKVVTDLLKRLGPAPGQAAEAAPGPLTYNEARLFQGHLSDLSVSEHNALNRSEQGLIKQLAKSFGSDVQAGADAAGAGPEHAIGMKEYAGASARNRTLKTAGEYATRAAGVGGLAELVRLIMQQKVTR